MKENNLKNSTLTSNILRAQRSCQFMNEQFGQGNFSANFSNLNQNLSSTYQNQLHQLHKANTQNIGFIHTQTISAADNNQQNQNNVKDAQSQQQNGQQQQNNNNNDHNSIQQAISKQFTLPQNIAAANFSRTFANNESNIQANNKESIDYMNKQMNSLMHSRTFVEYQFGNQFFDGDAFPPNLEKAKQHGKANRVCQFIDYSTNQEKKCECCGKVINNQLIPLSDDAEGMKHIGTCYPLYFTFIKQCFIYIFVMFLIQGLPALVLYINGEFCDSMESATFVCYVSFLNILEEEKKNTINFLSIINFIGIFVQLIMIEVFKIYNSKKVTKLESDRKGVTYYSVLVKHYPCDRSMDHLEDFLEKNVEGSKKSIIRMFLLYDLHLYDQLVQERKQIVDKINCKRFTQEKFSKDFYSKDDNLQGNKLREKMTEEEFQTMYDDYKKQIKELEKQRDKKQSQIQDLYMLLIRQGERNLDNSSRHMTIQQIQTEKHDKFNLKFTGRIIVTFNTFDVAEKVRKRFRKTTWEVFLNFIFYFFPKMLKKYLNRFYIDDSKLLIKQAPEPSDILWTGIASVKNKTKARIKSDLMVYGVMFIFILILIWFKVIMKQASYIYNAFWQSVFNLIVASLVAIANVVTGIIIRKNALNEERTTQTSYFIQVGRKLTKMFMTNMILTILIGSYIYNFFIKREDGVIKGDGTIEIFGNYIIGDYFFLFITNSYISSFMSICDIVWIVRLIKRYVMEKQVKEKRCWKSQAEANDIFEGHPIDMALRYANVLKVVLYTLAIATLLPIGGPMCLVGLIIVYWADKFLLFRRMVCKNYISNLLQKEMMKMLHMSTIYFSIGNFLTLMMPLYDKDEEEYKEDNQQDYKFIALSIIGMIVAFVFHYIPIPNSTIYYIYKKINKSLVRKPIQETYEELKEQIFEDYDLYHPAARENVVEKIIKDQQKYRESQQQLLLSTLTNNLNGIPTGGRTITQQNTTNTQVVDKTNGNNNNNNNKNKNKNNKQNNNMLKLTIKRPTKTLQEEEQQVDVIQEKQKEGEQDMVNINDIEIVSEKAIKKKESLSQNVDLQYLQQQMQQQLQKGQSLQVNGQQQQPNGSHVTELGTVAIENMSNHQVSKIQRHISNKHLKMSEDQIQQQDEQIQQQQLDQQQDDFDQSFESIKEQLYNNNDQNTRSITNQKSIGRDLFNSIQGPNSSSNNIMNNQFNSHTTQQTGEIIKFDSNPGSQIRLDDKESDKNNQEI